VSTRRPLLAVSLAVLACSPMALAQEDEAGASERRTPVATGAGRLMLLVDDELNTRVARVLALSSDGVTLLGENNTRETFTLDQLAALLPAGPDTRGERGPGALRAGEEAARGDGRTLDAATLVRRLDLREGGLLETTDGQRFPGTPGSGSGEETFSWEHEAFGLMTLPLERIARVITPKAPQAFRLTLERQPTADVLHLDNGDRLTGFIVRLGGPGADTVIETGGQTLELESERVLAATLANPLEPASGVIAWLDDGTVVRLESITPSGPGAFELRTPRGTVATYSLADLRALAPAAQRVVPLSDLELVEQGPLARRTGLPLTTTPHPDELLLGKAASLSADDVVLPGPMRVVFQLPRGVERFAATATLDPGAGAWADCELVVIARGVELARYRFTSEEPIRAVNVPLRAADDGAGPPSRLELRLEPGAFGPIHDTLILRRPIVLLEAKADGSS
jgi:hypothetical protein